ncbi:OLC1v1006031C1 [Oldenlandia corymbosa var. corymbosa]|uniref:OLC1v1006031C1 n=1 Tax=Oldenlandia corymbosa var. corymbosa TaxID=529605 RepID=A0AAV1DGD6_OLDCO|nr:OLC1v1006031C1 [Oldenlandia corymbosa var. corymbosa]
MKIDGTPLMSRKRREPGTSNAMAHIWHGTAPTRKRSTLSLQGKLGDLGDAARAAPGAVGRVRDKWYQSYRARELCASAGKSSSASPGGWVRMTWEMGTCGAQRRRAEENELNVHCRQRSGDPPGGEVDAWRRGARGHS